MAVQAGCKFCRTTGILIKVKWNSLLIFDRIINGLFDSSSAESLL